MNYLSVKRVIFFFCGGKRKKRNISSLEIKISGVPVTITMSYTNQFVPDIRDIVPVTKFWI